MTDDGTLVIPGPDSPVTLQEITRKTLRQILDLRVSEYQRNFVADNAVSIAQAHFSDVAWFRAVYAGDTPVGFVMVHDEPAKPEYFLWRFMIDQRFQGKGFGSKALQQVIAYVKSRPNASFMETSVVQKPGGPQPFYERAGFRLTGAMEEGEAVMRLDF